jgi:predicted metal-dependent hydrolase
MRARDAAGRPVPAGSPEAVEPVPEQALPPVEALALARELLAQGRPFFAHDVLEARWKVAPATERDLWQGLAQVCVGLTHLQRGNAVGGVRLLRRGAGRLTDWTGQQRSGPAYGVDVEQVVRSALAHADAAEEGGEAPRVEL